MLSFKVYEKVRFVFVRHLSIFLALLLCVLMQSCGSMGTQKNETKVAPLALTPPPPKESVEVKMLKRAELAFRNGNLTTPEHDNAYDLFQSVLMLNPNSQQARSGVQAILIRYAELIRQATEANQFSKSKRLLSQAELYYPANELLMRLKRENSRKQNTYIAQQKKIPDAHPSDLTVSEFALPAYALSKRTPAMKKYLADVASRLRESQESVMIYARTDTEGRWIYSQMKEAVPGYRVRGDIKLDRKPRLRLLPPLQ